MPEWQDSSHSLQEDLDTEMDSVGAKSCFHWRSWGDGGIIPGSSWLVSVCGPRGSCAWSFLVHQEM